jgi:hypothetical protein
MNENEHAEATRLEEILQLPPQIVAQQKKKARW